MSETIITVILPVISGAAALFNILVALTVILKKRLILDSTVYTGELVLADALFVMLLKSSFSDYQLVLIFLAVILVWCIFLCATKLSGSVYYRIFGIDVKKNSIFEEKLEEIKEENGIASEFAFLYCSEKKSPYTALVFKKTDKTVRQKAVAGFNGFLIKNCAFSFAPILAVLLNVAAIVIIIIRII